MSDENEEKEEMDEAVRIEIIEYMDDYALNKVDIEKYPISKIFLNESENIIKKYHDDMLKKIDKLEKQRIEFANKFSLVEEGKDKDWISEQINYIDEQVQYLKDSFELHKQRTNFECEINWRYYLAKSFLDTRGRFLSNMLDNMQEIQEETEDNTTYH